MWQPRIMGDDKQKLVAENHIHAPLSFATMI
jgi:hypothetical protein